MRILRAIRFWWQRRTRGWDDSDVWSLDVTIAKFILPRLRRLKELNDAYPASLNDSEQFDEESDERCMGEWHEKLDKMIESFEMASSNSIDYYIMSKKQFNKFRWGMSLFAKYYNNLWW